MSRPDPIDIIGNVIIVILLAAVLLFLAADLLGRIVPLPPSFEQLLRVWR